MSSSSIDSAFNKLSVVRRPVFQVAAAEAVLPVATRPVLASRVPASLPPTKKETTRYWFSLLLIATVLVNLVLAFMRSYHLRLDGDIAPIVLPRADYVHILRDPFGLDALLHNSVYAGPNRFFSHLAMVLYWRNVPLLLQQFMSPISSLYATQALFNTAMQALLLYVMGWYATGTRRLSSLRLWLAMALMVPFFQTTGYNRQMAIIDNAVTYNFFYALPLLLLLVLLWPLYRATIQGQPLRLSGLQLAAMLPLAVVLALSGPIITGTVLVLLLGVSVHAASQRLRQPAQQWLRGLPWRVVLLWGWLCVLSLYSLYIGRNNSENITTTMVPVAERYLLVPFGIFHTLTGRIGMPLLVLGCLGNVWLVQRLLPATPANRRLGLALRWVGLFALVYCLLLPLGGYRPYRHYILHHDCIVPITVGLVICYGLSAVRLLTQLRGRAQHWYIGAVVVMAAIYLNADRRLYETLDGVRERQHLELLAAAGSAPVVQLPYKRTVLTWDPVNEPLSSLTSAEMLHYWGVTKDIKLYYYPLGKRDKELE